MIPTEECTKPYATNGSQTVFPITFPFHDESHIKVFIRNNATSDEQELGNPEDFSVVGSNVVTAVTWPSGYTLLIMRDHPYTQDLDLLEGGKLPAEPLEKRVDKNVMMIQQILEMLSRIPKFKKTTSYKNIEMSEPAEDHFLLWKNGALKFVQHFGPASIYDIQAFMGTFLESLTQVAALSNLGITDAAKTLLDDPTISAILTTLGFSTFIKTLIDDADAQEARNTLGVETFPIGTILMYKGTGIANVSTRSTQIGDEQGDTISMPGWYACNGNVSTPNLLNKFIRSESASGNTGGSDDAVVVGHNHGGATGGMSANNPHSHSVRGYWDSGGSTNYINRDNDSSSPNDISGAALASNIEHTHSIASAGESGTGKNKPAYYSLIFIIKMS